MSAWCDGVRSETWQREREQIRVDNRFQRVKRKAKTQSISSVSCLIKDQTGLVLYFYILELCRAKVTFVSSIVLGENFISFGEP